MILHNNQDPYTIALVHLNKEKAQQLAHEQHLNLKTKEGKAAILQEIRRAFDKYKADGDHPDLFPERWLPTAIAILPEGFTEENKMLNSTMKIVRGRITDHYVGTIDYLYTSEGKEITNPVNMKVMEQLFG
jgi:long-chain acyl-CoA synthetase